MVTGGDGTIARIVAFLQAFRKGNGLPLAQCRAVGPKGWSALLRQLKPLGMAPLFYNRLSAPPLAVEVPASVLRALQEEYFLHAARNAVALDDLGCLLGIMNREGIKAVVLKGGCLVDRIYTDIALRPMQDIDILVRREDLQAVETVLSGMGYGPADRPPVREQCRMHHHLVPFTHPGGPPVEVHWSITPAGSGVEVTLEDVLEKAEKIQVNGSPGLMLSTEDLLIHLCLHLSINHRFSILELKNIWDISMVLHRHGANNCSVIDWVSLAERARRFGVSKYVYSTLKVAKILSDDPASTEDIELTDHDDNDTEMAEIVAGYFLGDEEIRLPDLFSPLHSGRKPRRRIRAFLDALFPGSGHLARKYGTTARGRSSVQSLQLHLSHWKDVLARGAVLAAHFSIRSRKARATARRRRDEIIINRWLRSTSELRT